MNEPGRMPIQTQAGAALRRSEISVSQYLHHTTASYSVRLGRNFTQGPASRSSKRFTCV